MNDVIAPLASGNHTLFIGEVSFNQLKLLVELTKRIFQWLKSFLVGLWPDSSSDFQGAELEELVAGLRSHVARDAGDRNDFFVSFHLGIYYDLINLILLIIASEIN